MAIGNGISLFPWRAQKWAGHQTWTTTDHGEHLAVKIAGGYVGGQGLELRTFPGWKCLINPADGAPGSPGYQQLVVDAERPVAGPKGPNDSLRERVPYDIVNGAYGAVGSFTAGVDESLRVWAERRRLFSFHRLRDKIVLIGETGLRIEPILDSATRTIISQVSKWVRVAGVAVLTLTPNPGAIVADSPNQIQVGDVLYLHEIADANAADAARLARRAHYVTAYNAGLGEVTLSTTVAADSVSTTLTVHIGRSRGNRTGPASFAPDGISEFELDAQRAILDDESLTAFWVEDPLNIDGDPVQAAHPSYVANRQRDFGDIAYTAGGFRRLEGHRPAAFGGAARFGIPRRRTIRLPFRPVPQLAGDRVLLAVPGYGCIMQIPAIIPTTSSTSSFPTRGPVQNYNDSAARPRSCGIPKAILAVPNDVTGAPTITVRADLLGYAPNNTGAPIITTVRVAAAYRDEATGEVGLLSEIWKFTVTVPAGNSLNLRAAVMHPAYALAECLAFSIMLFASKPNDEALLHVATIQANDDQAGVFAAGVYVNGMGASSVYGMPPTDGVGGFAAEAFWYYTFPAILASTPTLFNAAVEIPTERNMPRGAAWLRVVRGVRLSGGGVGDMGQKLELQGGEASLQYGGTASTHNNPREITILRQSDELAFRDEWHFIGNRFIPSAYAGCRVWSRTLFPFPQEAGTLEKMMNAHGDATINATALAAGADIRHYIRWQCVENPHRWEGTRAVADQASHIVLPRGIVQIGEPGLPSVQSGFGNQIVDAQKDEDTVAGGEVRGVALMMTQFQTYAMSWSQGPAGSIPVLLSSDFGCIAPNTSIEYEGGAFWVSERGPCVCNGETVQSVSSMDKWFHGETNRFLRDSQGMMRHAWAFHDEARQLVLVGLLENRNAITIQWDGAAVTWATASDQAKSRFPCDTVLAMNTATGAWTEWQIPAGMEILWMAAVPCSDGVQRSAFMDVSGRIHSLDDLFGEDNQEPLHVAISEGTAGAWAVVSPSLGGGQTVGTNNAARGSSGALLRVGMDVCVFDSLTYELKYRGQVSEIDVLGSAIKLSGIGSWTGNCTALIGARTMTMTMTAVTPKGVDATTIQAITVKGKLASRIQVGGAGSLKQPTWVKSWVAKSTDRVNGATEGGDSRRVESRLHTNPLGDLFGISDELDTPRSKRMHQGTVTGKTLQVRLEVFGGSQACLNDVLMEVS